MGLLTSLFALLGYSGVLPESLMDSVTACSGSGIAYVSVCVNIHTNVQEEIKCGNQNSFHICMCKCCHLLVHNVRCLWF